MVENWIIKIKSKRITGCDSQRMLGINLVIKRASRLLPDYAEKTPTAFWDALGKVETRFKFASSTYKIMSKIFEESLDPKRTSNRKFENQRIVVFELFQENLPPRWCFSPNDLLCFSMESILIETFYSTLFKSFESDSEPLTKTSNLEALRLPGEWCLQYPAHSATKTPEVSD